MCLPRHPCSELACRRAAAGGGTFSHAARTPGRSGGTFSHAGAFRWRSGATGCGWGRRRRPHREVRVSMSHAASGLTPPPAQPLLGLVILIRRPARYRPLDSDVHKLCQANGTSSSSSKERVCPWEAVSSGSQKETPCSLCAFQNSLPEPCWGPDTPVSRLSVPPTPGPRLVDSTNWGSEMF